MAKVETKEVAPKTVYPNEKTLKVLGVFKESVEKGDNEDATKMAMVMAGCPFKRVARLYNDFRVETGMTDSQASQDEILKASLSGIDLKDESKFASAVAAVNPQLKGGNEKITANRIRAWAKKNKRGCCARPKNVGHSEFSSSFYNWLSSNGDASEQDATSFINGDGDHASTSSSIKRHTGRFLDIYRLVKEVRSQKA